MRFVMNDAATAAALTTRGLTKQYVGGDGSVLQILDGIDLEVSVGEIVAVIGQSGAGKSTLLQILGGLDRPTAGDVWIGDRRIADLEEATLAALRNERIGFVFQFHHLLREFTALENVMMPQLIAGAPPQAAREWARELLHQVGLERRVEHKSTQLSGGEQQRVAVARALANRPVVVLADEPSGNLDVHTSELLHDLLFRVSRQHAAAMVLVTHNHGLAARSDRVLRLREGRIERAEDFVGATDMERYAE